MSSKTSFKSKKSGKKFSDFCFVVLFLFSFRIFSQQTDLITIQGKALNSEDKTIIPNLIITLEISKTSYITTKTDSNGYFKFNISKGLFNYADIVCEQSLYVRTPTAPKGFFPPKKTFINNDSIKEQYIIFIQPVGGCFPEFFIFPFQFEKETIVLLDSAFIYDQYRINKDFYINSIYQLQSYYQILIDNPTLKVEISGHCSSDENNPEELSKYRAELIKQILVSKGINRERLIEKGWGIRKLKIEDKEISKAKTKSEQELLRQINRRVSLKITGWDYDNTKH